MYNILILILATAACCLAALLSDEERLVNWLLRDDVAFTIVRPAGDANHMVTVNMSIKLNGIKSFDTSTGKIELELWKTMTWMDNRLMWNQQKSGEIDRVHLPSSKIWTPDIVLYSGTEVALSPEKSVIARSDSVFYVSISVAQTTCSSDDSLGDKWTCTLKYGSWLHDGQELDLQLNSELVDSTNFWNRDWHLTSSSANRNSAQFACCPGSYVDLTFTLTFTRRTKQ